MATRVQVACWSDFCRACFFHFRPESAFREVFEATAHGSSNIRDREHKFEYEFEFECEAHLVPLVAVRSMLHFLAIFDGKQMKRRVRAAAAAATHNSTEPASVCGSKLKNIAADINNTQTLVLTKFHGEF